jgi:hypothetical protein
MQPDVHVYDWSELDRLTRAEVARVKQYITALRQPESPSQLSPAELLAQLQQHLAAMPGDKLLGAEVEVPGEVELSLGWYVAVKLRPAFERQPRPVLIDVARLLDLATGAAK